MYHTKNHLLAPSLSTVAALAGIAAMILLLSFDEGHIHTPLALAAFPLAFYVLLCLVARLVSLSRHREQHAAVHISKTWLAGLLFNLVYAVFKVFAGALYDSMWFGAEGMYYAVLSAIRFSVLPTVGDAPAAPRARGMRQCGYLLLLLDGVTVVTVIEMFRNADTPANTLMFALTAVYTLYRVAAALRVFLRGHLNAAMMPTLAALLFSLFSLQYALLGRFAPESEHAGVLNAVTGLAVCAAIAAMGLGMVKRSKKYAT